MYVRQEHADEEYMNELRILCKSSPLLGCKYDEVQ